jgi:ArsR family transcriptional regulator
MNAIELETQNTQLHADLCASLGSPHRIKILYTLAERSYCVNDLSAHIGASQATTSRHLKALKDRGLVRAVRRGAMIEYRLTDYRLIEALDLLHLVLRDRLVHRARIVRADRS